MSAPGPAAGGRWNNAVMEANNQLIVVGYAKVPDGSTLRAHQEYVSVSLRIDKASGIVAEVDSNAVTAVVRGWLSELLLGLDFSAPIDDVLTVVEENYLGHGAASIRQAVLDAWRRYSAYRRSTQ
jgi:hypothetical protein